jgi:fused signal recognition particle receptor
MFGFGKRKNKAPTETAIPEPSAPAQAIEDTAPPAAMPAREAATAPPAATPEKKGLFARLKSRLGRTRENFTDGLANLVLGRKRIDSELLEELETLLLVADVGVDATSRIIDHLSGQVKRKELSDPEALSGALKAQLQAILDISDVPVKAPTEGRPQVILMVGINGAGKTTTIGKLARRLQAEGNSVMLAAGDTFRAAAVEQLQTWGERNQIPVIAQHTGADSASVIFDALQAATARGVDVLIADTAGRLHTKSNLMEELAKIARVMKKIDPEAPHEVMLVVDATTGQNALNQAEQFNLSIPLTGITLTKLDGTAKGGILFAIADKLGIPIRFIGVGEAIEDLRPFDAKEFVGALFEK